MAALEAERWLTAQEISVRVYGMETNTYNGPSASNRRYDIPFGFGKVPVWSRGFFRDAGIAVDEDYVQNGEAVNTNDAGQHSFQEAFGWDYLHIYIEYNDKQKLKVAHIGVPHDLSEHSAL